MSNEFMKADKILTADINKAASYEELQALLHNAVERSGIADRDPQTGQFVRRDPSQSAAPVVAPDDEKQITKTETIGGKEFVFKGSAIEVERQIGEAYKIADAVQQSMPIVQPVVRAKTQAEIDREIFDRAELDIRLKTGQITTAEYLEQSGAVDEYLAKKGFDVDAAANKQFEQSWQQATEEFLRNTPEGRSWVGGERNKELMGRLLLANGLDHAEDKIAALQAVAREMIEKNLIFDGDVSEQQLIEMTNNMTPQEILESWKAAQPDAETANSEFIRINGGTGGMFDK